jgi:hypothetical protein
MSSNDIILYLTAIVTFLQTVIPAWFKLRDVFRNK